MLRLLFFLGLLASSSELAWAHGSVFPPIPLRTGPGQPGRSLSPNGSRTRAVPKPPTSMPRPRTSGGTLKSATGDDLSSWHWWWEFNKEPYLAIKQHLYDEDPTSGDGRAYLGPGVRRANRSSRNLRPTRAQITEQVLPALERELERTRSNDMITACLIALARVGDDQAAPERAGLEPRLRAFLANPVQEIAETAAAALGILGNDSSALILAEILLDTTAGRRAVGKSETPLRSRAFAAYGLGLIGEGTDNEDVRRYVVHKLAAALEQDEEVTADVGVACVIALGRVPLPFADTARVPASKVKLASTSRTTKGLPATSSRAAQIRFLLDLLESKDTHRIVRAHVPTALGYLSSLPADSDRLEPGDDPRPAVVHALIATLSAPRVEREVQLACVLALGRLADADEDRADQAARDVLSSIEDVSADVLVRHLALISLARCGARTGQSVSKNVLETRKHLLDKLGGGSTEARIWAGLALALFERKRAEQGIIPHADSIEALRFTLEETSSSYSIGALAISAGLLREPRFVEVLIAKLDGEVADDATRGQLALGLGLLQAREASDRIRELVESATYRPLLLRDAAIALGILGDAEVTDLLLANLRSANSLSAQASIAQAVGRIGDARAVDPLVAMLVDEELTDRARAFAAVALGVVADEDDLPWNATLSVDTNYPSATPTLFDLGGFGILNIL